MQGVGACYSSHVARLRCKSKSQTLTIGAASPYPGAFGVDAVDAGEASYLGHTLPVGSYPVAIKAYGSALVFDYNDGSESQSHSGPASAIVVNSDSNNVTILNLANYTTTTTIPVGTQPMAVVLNSRATMAYVANYGSGTVSEINLSSLIVSRTATIGPAPQSVAMDPSGSYVWVGASNYLYKVSLSTFTVVASYPVSGSITSMAASNAQNELVYTLVQNCCSGSSTYVANEVSLSDMSGLGSHSQSAASAYAPYTMNGTLPSAAVIPTATAVSAQFGNAFAASATPTGFVIYETVGHQTVMSGATPTPVRGIAGDPNNWVAYFSVPDSNELITVPLPH
jgi:YVTN family beta-propeller protein